MQLLRFSDDVILPFDLTRYAVKIKNDWNQWKLEFREILANQSISIGLSLIIFKTVNSLRKTHPVFLRKTHPFDDF